MITVFWARHGENEANISRRFSHRVLDLDLTDVGRRQAVELADALAEVVRDSPGRRVVFCSPLRRAWQTAEVVAERLAVPFMEHMDDLRELNVGALDGRSDDEAWATYESVLSAWRDGDRTARFPRGEDWHELCRRLRRALGRVARSAGNGPAIVVAHGANLRAALPGLAGAPDPGVDLATGSFATLSVDGRVDTLVASVESWPGVR